MKTISLNNTSKNWFYTIKEHDTAVVDRTISGKVTIHGICREPSEPGDTFTYGIPPNKRDFIIESITKQDSKGKFNNPSDAINALFTAECSFSRLIN